MISLSFASNNLIYNLVTFLALSTHCFGVLLREWIDDRSNQVMCKKGRIYVLISLFIPDKSYNTILKLYHLKMKKKIFLGKVRQIPKIKIM